MKALAAILLVLAAPVRAEAPAAETVAQTAPDAPLLEPGRYVLEVDHGSVVTPSGLALDIQGGAYLDEQTLLAVARELSALRAETAVLRNRPMPPMISTPMAVAMMVATLGMGVGSYFLLKR